MDSKPGDRAGGGPPGIPALAELLRWLSEMPEAFRAAPLGLGGELNVAAVVFDLFDTLFGNGPDEDLLQAFTASGRGQAARQAERNRLAWVLAACHLLWHPDLRRQSLYERRVRALLLQDLATLATVASAERLVDDEQRREELIRRALRALDLRLPGESAAEADDRLAQVDSVERRRLLAAASERERRSREVRDMMARKAAEEAAAKVSRE